MIAAPKDSKINNPLGAPAAAGDPNKIRKTLFEGLCGVKIGVLRSGKVIS